MKKYYLSVRALHLYVGLFISPFILIFGISVLVFNHAGFINKLNPVKELPDIKMKLDKVPYDTSDLSTAKAIIKKLNITGEIDFISKNDSSISFPVTRPGLRTYIKVNVNTDSVFITRKNEGTLRSMTYLHSMPGPHNVKLRGNSAFITTWRVIADVAVYFLLFLTVTGIFLWYILKNERLIGFYSIALGLLFFTGLLLLIF